MTRLSVVIPMLNEAHGIVATLDSLAPLRARGHEVIAVDGGSRDNTAALCLRRADLVLSSPPGRARQMNTGARHAGGDVLVFLHADTTLPKDADVAIHQALEQGKTWGWFNVRISGKSRLLPVIALLMNFRSRWSGIATGDQAIFVRRDMFARLGEFPLQALMEDIEFSKRLLALSRPACLRQRVITSGRRWDNNGVWRTILLMWRLRWRYWRGAPADELARFY